MSSTEEQPIPRVRAVNSDKGPSLPHYPTIRVPGPQTILDNDVH